MQVGKGPGSKQKSLGIRRQEWPLGYALPTPFTFTNSFDEGTNGTTITTGNSGSATDHAFDNVGSVAGGTVAFDNTQIAHGTLSGKFATGATSGVSDAIWNQLSIQGLQQQVWFRAYVFLTAYNVTTRVIEFLAGESSLEAASVAINASGQLIGRDANSTTLFTFTAAVPLGQWFRIEGTVVGGAANGVFMVSWYDGDSLSAVETHTASNANTAGQIAGVRYGITFLGGSNVGPFWLDEIGLSNIGPLGPVGALGYPLQGPVRAAIRNLAAPPRGRVYSNPGIYDQVGPPFRADSSPVAAGSTSAASSSRNGATRPRRGTTTSNKGICGQTGPAVYPLQHPVAAVVRPLPPRGRTTARTGFYGQVGPPVKPLPDPVQARRPLPPRGRNAGNPGFFGQLGPAVRALTAPVAAVIRPLARRGRISSNPGTYGQLGPAVKALAGPVRAAIRVLPPRGRSYWRAGTYGQLGPPVTPLPGPVSVHHPLPPRGRIGSNPGVFTFIQPPLAPLYPLPGPVRAAVRVLPRRGRSLSNAGAFAQTGPPVTPLRGPVRAAIRVLPPRGRTASRAGLFEQTGPPFYALNRPASAVVRPLPRRGRTWTLAGTFGQAGPPVKALQHPVAAVTRPLPPRGRIYRQSGTYEGTGPQLTPPQGPVRAAYRFRPPRGRAQGGQGTRGQTGPPVKPLQGPVVVHRYTLPPRGRDYGVFRAQPYQPGPPVRPLPGPVRSRQPLPPRGRTYQTPAFVASALPTTGTGYPYKAVLQQARWSAAALPAREPSQETQQEWEATLTVTS